MQRLTLEQARRIIDGALADSARQGFKPMAVVVVDEAGEAKAIFREDGATPFRIRVATAKAYAAASMGASSRALMQRAEKSPTFMTSLAAIAEGRFVAQAGAVLIQGDGGEILGAVGASGGTGDEDEAICIAGVAAAGLQHG